MQVTRRRVLTAGVLGGVTAAAGACSRRTTSTSAALRKVTYVTGLGSYGREGAPWVASAKGYFQQVGLDVSIVAGAAGDSNLTMLAAGRAQFAEIDYTGAVMRAG